MKWVSHIVETPTQQTVAVNEMDYSQVSDDINFMLRPCSGGQLSLQIFAWTFFTQETYSGPSDDLFSSYLSPNILCVGTGWCEYNDVSLAEMSEAFFFFF